MMWEVSNERQLFSPSLVSLSCLEIPNQTQIPSFRRAVGTRWSRCVVDDAHRRNGGFHVPVTKALTQTGTLNLLLTQHSDTSSHQSYAICISGTQLLCSSSERDRSNLGRHCRGRACLSLGSLSQRQNTPATMQLQ